LPAGACDSHIHVFGKEYKKAPTAVAEPPHAPLSEYLKLQRRLGLERAVIVQPTHYGADNACTLAAVAALGPSACGVAMLDMSATDAEIDRLTQPGIRGLRVQMFPGGIISWDEVETMAARVVEFGWFVQLQFDGRQFPEREAMIRKHSDGAKLRRRSSRQQELPTSLSSRSIACGQCRGRPRATQARR
jgi:D-galactarolactone isomerase